VRNINCFSGPEAIEPLPMRMPMVMVKPIGFYFKNSAAAAAGSIVILRHEPLKVLLVLHPITNAVETDAQITHAVQVK
jgi:hypothetical protein